MRTLYTRIALTCFGTLSLALAGFLVISRNVGVERMNENVRSVARLELKVAEQIYYERGPDALRAFIAEIDESFNSRHLVVDAAGRDVVTNQDLSEMIERKKPLTWTRRLYRLVTNVEQITVWASPTSELSMISVTRPWTNSRAQIPFYLAIVLVVSLLNALVAARIVSALRTIARVTRQFGAGDLTARIRLDGRADEVGLVSDAFNRMADRMQALVVSERRLLQDVSHEVRSPLARLSFAVELAEHSDDRTEAFAIVRRQLTILKDLAGSLLQATRASDGQPLRDVQTFPARNLVDDVVDTNLLNAKARGCRVTVIEAAPSAVGLSGDYSALLRVVDNLLRNAIEYSSTDGPIEITIDQSGTEAILEVRDHGPGVPEAMLARIFEPFVRVEASRNSANGGVGLGLSIVERTVLLHGGSVRARNASPGLAVVVRLPLAAAQARPAAGIHPGAADPVSPASAGAAGGPPLPPPFADERAAWRTASGCAP